VSRSDKIPLVWNSKYSRCHGREACIRKTRIPVWLLISYRRQNATDAHILEGHPDICAADLVNAFSYAEAYPDEIETAIQENEED
jgi:uncharacterized protein (DUF433 family)